MGLGEASVHIGYEARGRQAYTQGTRLGEASVHTGYEARERQAYTQGTRLGGGKHTHRVRG